MDLANPVKSRLKPRWFSLTASGSLIALLMSVLLFLQNQNTQKPEAYTVREIKLTALPPPPPPPPTLKTTHKKSPSTIAITHSGSGVTIEFGKLNITDELSLDDITPPPLELDNTPFLNDSLSLALNDIFSLDDLDDRPRLLTTLDIRYPKKLSQRGIHTVTARIEVLIDTDGQTRLKQIISSSHAEINPQIQSIMKRTRFTPPKKDGVPVRASFNWPLEFNDS